MKRLLHILLLALVATALPGHAAGLSGMTGLTALTALGGAAAPAVEADTLHYHYLTSGSSTTDAASKNTASITPTPNALVVAVITSTKGTTPDIPTLTGNGLTWVQLATIPYATSGTSTERTTAFRAMGASTSAGAVSIAWAGTQTGYTWHIYEFQNADSSGTNGSGAIVQALTNFGDSTANPNITYSAPGSSANALLFAYGDDQNSPSDSAAPQAWTEEEELSYGTPSAGSVMMYQLNAINATSVTATATSRNWGAILLEIKPTTKAAGLVVGTGFLDLNGQTDGATLTAAILAAGQRGSGFGTFSFGSSFVATDPGGFTVQPSMVTRLRSVRIDTTTYLPASGSHRYSLDTSTGQNFAIANIPSISSVEKRRQVKVGCFLRINNSSVNGGELYDLLRLEYGLSGVATICQWKPGTGGGLNIEAAGGATVHSLYYNADTTGATIYAVMLSVDMYARLATLDIYSLAGAKLFTLSVAIDAGSVNDYIAYFRFGNVEFGSHAGTIDFEDIVIDSGGGQFILY